MQAKEVPGTKPQKFRLKHKRHAYADSPHSHFHMRSELADSFGKMVVTHEVYEVPEIAPKITNVPAPDIREANPFAPILDRKNSSGAIQDSPTKNIKHLRATSGEARVPSRPNESPVRAQQINEETRKTLQRTGQDLLKREADNGYSRNDAPPSYQENVGQTMPRIPLTKTPSYEQTPPERMSQNNFVSEDALDRLRTEVDARKTGSPTASETQLKKALHNFYGVTPPASTTSSYYNKIDLNRWETGEDNRKLTDSYYQAAANDTLKKAQMDPALNKALKNFFGTDPTPQNRSPGQYNSVNNSFSYPSPPKPLGTKDLVYEQKKIDYSFGGYLHSQYFKPKPQLVQKPELPFVLDPITHQKVYKAPVQNNQSYAGVELGIGIRPENDYFYVRSNSPDKYF